MSFETNKATLIELYQNLGPGMERLTQAYQKALTPDISWWISGVPLVTNMEEAIAQGELFFTATPAVANPILDFRRIEGDDEGREIYFERHGSFADENNNTLADWDIMGVYYFNDEGKIYAIRDYLDNYRIYAFLRKVGFPEEQIKAMNDAGMESHPLNKGQKADPHFYRNMMEQLAAI